MSPGVAARRRFGFALGCGCKDPKAVAVAAAAVAASSPRSGTEASTATTATSRRARTHPSGSASTGTLTVPSASSSFLWEDADADGEEVEVEFKRPSSATTPSFSGLLRELSELERSVKTSCARKSPGRNHFSPPPPPPPPLPPRPVRVDDKTSVREGHGNFSPPSPPSPPPPPPPPSQSRPLQRRAVVRTDDKSCSIKEGHGDFSPPRPRPPSPQVQVQAQQHRRVKSVDKVNRQEGDPHFTLPLPPGPLPPPPPLDPLLPRAKTEEDGPKKKEDSKRASTPPKHRKAKSCDNGSGGGNNRLDGSVAVVKQSEDPLGDFRRSMLSMIVENGIVAGDELRELLRRFLALNAPRHHDAILRAFAEIWDEVFAAPASADDPRPREPARQTAAHTRQRTPPRRRQPLPLPAWRV